MNKGQLSTYFMGVAVKRLSAVDANPEKSNQHEIGTTTEMKDFLGEVNREKFSTNYIWLGEEQEGISHFDFATHYDTRHNQPMRSAEWRLYYSYNPVTEMMAEGDTLFLAKRSDGSLLFIIVACGSTIESQLLWLFGFDSQPQLKFIAQNYSADNDATLDFAARFILDEIGIEFEDPNANSVDTIVSKFDTFPKTLEFSDLARLTLPSIDARDDPDLALMAWLDHEEAMFRRLEFRLLADRISKGFMKENGEADIDGFVSFSLSVQNRRKSRMGQSFEHQLRAVFDAIGISYAKKGKTERNNEPDFIFPDMEAYNDAEFPTSRLAMLALKASCKERWRQVLPEADRIKAKHLITLEPGISQKQTDQMRSHLLQLVVPAAIHVSYKPAQQSWLWSVRDFANHVLRLQR
jgi:EcoRII C terminal